VAALSFAAGLSGCSGLYNLNHVKTTDLTEKEWSAVSASEPAKAAQPKAEPANATQPKTEPAKATESESTPR
jgi:hypothetical protein